MCVTYSGTNSLNISITAANVILEVHRFLKCVQFPATHVLPP
jgi:hypothetical protein